MPAREMAILDAAASLARLNVASVRLRGARTPDDVLDVLGEEARAATGVDHAWTARVDGTTLVSVRSTLDESTPSTDARPPLPPPPLASLLAERLGDGSQGSSSASASASTITRADGFVAVTLLGSSGVPEGVLALPQLASTTPADDAALDLVLAPLAIIAGLALESARARRRSDAVTRAREVLLASVSHDLRNPLNTFAMSAGLLRDDLERNDVDVARGISLVSRMERATSRMQSLIEDLVEASRIDARKIDYAIRAERASQLLKDAIAAATPATPEKGAVVTSDTLQDEARVMADRARTLQALAKIIAFEAKSTGDGGTIRLASARHGDAVHFTARAIGPGGAPVPPPEEGRGGLALLIARGLVEAQRGTFRIEAGEGLVVAFTLPAATP